MVKTTATEGKKFNNKKIIAALNFDASNSEILVQVALSAVSIEGAKKNLEAEFSNWDFDKVKDDAKTVWESVIK